MDTQSQTHDQKKRAVGISLDDDTRALADQIAADEERSRSQVARRTIHQYAETKGTQ